jgi:ethanolaminephosphotransferase
LYFGWLSGPVEGTLALISLCLFSAYVGGAFWLKNISLPFGLGIIKTNMVIVYSTIFLALITVVFAFKNAFTTSGFAAIWRAVPFLFFMSTCVALYAANPELSTFPNYILYFLICGFAFASSVARIIAAHITKGDYPLWTPAYLPIIIAVLRTLNGKYQLIPHMLQGPLTRFLSISLVYNLVVYGRLIIGIISQLCQYLGINCLTVSKQRQE